MNTACIYLQTRDNTSRITCSANGLGWHRRHRLAYLHWTLLAWTASGFKGHYKDDGVQVRVHSTGSSCSNLSHPHVFFPQIDSGRSSSSPSWWRWHSQIWLIWPAVKITRSGFNTSEFNWANDQVVHQQDRRRGRWISRTMMQHSMEASCVLDFI